eukprot:gene19613-26297_t
MANSDIAIKVIILVSIVFISILLIKQHNVDKKPKKEKFLMGAPLDGMGPENAAGKGVVANVPAELGEYKPVDFKTADYPKDCFPRDKLSAQDLLPANSASSTWAQTNPFGQGDVGSQNYLNAGYHFGIDTQMSSLMNASLDIRSIPVIPKSVISPWMQSSYDPDLNRRPLEIGGCA